MSGRETFASHETIEPPHFPCRLRRRPCGRSRHGRGAASQKSCPAPGANRAPPEVVIIGAGAAGIAAARRLVAAGRSVVLLEAAAEVGGRCITDTKTFGVPYDRGANWIYNADINPLVKLAPPDRARRLSGAARPARAHRPALCARKRDGALARRDRARQQCHCRRRPQGRRRLRAGAAEGSRRVAPDHRVHARPLWLRQGPCARFPRSTSRARPTATTRRFAARVLARCWRSLQPVCRCSSQRRRPRSIGVCARRCRHDAEGPHHRARAAIVTASTNVLAAGKIRFDPELPRRYLDAVTRLKLGSYDHIALELPDNPLGLRSDELVFEKSEGRAPPRSSPTRPGARSA